MPIPSDFTVIGGGIMGLLCARELVLVGASVTLIDQSQPGQEASWAGGGILLPLYPWRQDPAISALVMASLKLYPPLVSDLIGTSGIDPEWQPCGLLITKNPDIEAAIDWCNQYHLRYSTNTPVSTSNLKGDQLNPLWLPEIAQIRNPRLLKSLKQWLLNHQVRFIDNSQLLNIKTKQQRLHSIITSTGEFAVEQLVLTTGAWTGNIWSTLFPDAETKVDVQPIKGQMLLFDAKPGLLPHIVLDQDRYLIPRRDGRIVVGSTIEHCGFDKHTTAEARAQLQAFAEQLLPPLKACPITHHWAGLRPGTAHGIPYIDSHPVLRNLSVCAGHYRNGLTMAPASARLLVDLICQRPPLVPAPAYQLSAHH